MKNKLLLLLLTLPLAMGCKKDTPRSTPTLSTSPVTNITSNTANTGGDITSTGGSPISKSGVVYSLHNNPSVSDSVNYSTISGTGTFQNILTNLNANATYYVAAFAINGSGTAYGNVDSFSTARGLPTISTNAVTPNSQSLTAVSGWKLLNNGGSPIIATGLVWSTSPLPTVSNIFKTSDSINTTSFIDTLTGLNVATYYVRAYATNGYGTGYGSQQTFTLTPSAGIVTDFDGNDYTTVIIGSQTWMGSNLKVTHYQNGDPITNGSSVTFNWDGPILANVQNHTVFEGAYTFPNGDSANKRIYGLLYNNFTIDDSRGVCPAGWHVSSVGDWEILAFHEGATDTSFYTGNHAGGLDNEFDNIASNLLVGGSSGLNLQLAGECGGFSYNSSIGQYGAFNMAGFYYQSNIFIPNGVSMIGNNSVISNNNVQIGATYSVPNAVLETTSYFAYSIRCVKN